LQVVLTKGGTKLEFLREGSISAQKFVHRCTGTSALFLLPRLEGAEAAFAINTALQEEE
jgi:hypothetical protein